MLYNATRRAARAWSASATRPARALLPATASLPPRLVATSPSWRGCAGLAIAARRSSSACAQLEAFDRRRSGARRGQAASARRISARAARTTPRPRCPKAAARWPASAATSWRSGWTAAPTDHADGRRRRRLDRAGAVHRRASTSSRTSATAPTTTRGILAIRAAVAAERQHHLQDPVQRRGGDDRRPAGRRRPHRAQIAHQVAAEGVEAHRRRLRRAGEVPTRATSPAASTVHHRDELDAVQRELRECRASRC